MLLRNRVPDIHAIDETATPSNKAFEQIDDQAIAVIRWLNANRVDYVLVGAVAQVIHGNKEASGPVSIAPAPYGRNLDRLARALWAARARQRPDASQGSAAQAAAEHSVPVKVDAEKLIRPERWTLRCGSHDLDVEGRPAGVPRYQELLYEANKVELADGVAAEVASPADIEHYDHMRRHGVPPEVTVTRAVSLQEASS